MRPCPCPAQSTVRHGFSADLDLTLKHPDLKPQKKNWRLLKTYESEGLGKYD